MRNPHTPETRAKISAAHTGKSLSEEHKQRIGAAQKGRHRSAETRAKISAALQGKTFSAESKQKMSAARKGKPIPGLRAYHATHKFTPSETQIESVRAANRARALPEEERKARRKTSGRASRLKDRYGITLAEYEALLAAQGGVCAICRKACSTGKSLAVDHNHETKVVRGLLCRKCNRGIGHFNDDRTLLQEAINYLSAKLE